MAVIDQYTSRILGQGQIDSRASGADFGAQVGEGLQNVGNGLASVGQAVQDVADTQDITSVHVELAKKRAEWTQQMQDRTNAAVPGDETFAPKVMEDMTKDINSIGDNLTSRKAQRLLTTMGATMTSEFGQRAIGVQAQLAGAAAVNSYNDLIKASGQTVFNDQSQYEAVTRDAELAIKNGEGMFGKVPQTQRDEFLSKVKNDIDFAAARGLARRDPAGLLASVAPDQLEQFEPAQKVLQSNAAPGGRVSVSPGAMKWAPQVTAAAAAKGVNPSILLAQIDKESRGNPDAINKGDTAVTGSASVGLAQFQPGTAKQYGIDPTKPDQSIKGQAAYMADLLKAYGGNYQKALAAYNWGPGNLNKSLARWGNDWQSHLPSSVKDYVSTIMTKSGQVVSPTATEPDATATPSVDPALDPATRPAAASSIPYFGKLTWQQQDQVVGEAVRLQHLKMTMAERARSEAERAKKVAQETTRDDYQKQIFNPTKYGEFDPLKVTDDPLLSPDQKLHLIQTSQAATRQNAEPKTHPQEVSRLYNQIIAGVDDPTKTFNGDNVREASRMGIISPSESDWLLGQVEKLRDGTNSSFQRQVVMAHKKAEDMFMKDFTATLPGGAAYASDALYRFRFDLDKKIVDLRKENKDPSGLLDPSSRDYMLTPDRMKAYMPKAMQLMQDQAKKETAAQMKPGYVQDGYRFKGGNPADKANWEAVK